MLVTRFNPFKEFKDLEKKFYDFYPSKNIAEDGAISAFMPKVNTREDEKAYYVDIDLPGVKKEEISIDVKDGVLSISGERNFKEEVKEEHYYKVETSFGKFQRSFSLPENIDMEKIGAKNENGVLEVVIPKLDKIENSKKIEIK